MYIYMYMYVLVCGGERIESFQHDFDEANEKLQDYKCNTVFS